MSALELTPESLLEYGRNLDRWYRDHDWGVPVYSDGVHGVVTPLSGVRVVYIVEFDKGLLKVGQTSQFDRRMRGLATRGLKRGQYVSRFWTVAVTGVLEFEAQMIADAHALGGDCVSGREWFEGVSFDSMRALAESRLERVA